MYSTTVRRGFESHSRRQTRGVKPKLYSSEAHTKTQVMVKSQVANSKKTRSLRRGAPHELLNLKIKDIIFKRSHNGIQYAEILVSGKTTSRTLPLIKGIPYLKEWVNVHPFANTPDAPLSVSISRANFGDPLTRDGMLKHYQEHYTDDYFPKLLDNPAIETKEKETIRKLLHKPWNLYVQRHSTLTDKSQILKETTLRDHAGWSMTSNVPSVHLHYFGTESSNSILQAYGIINDDNKKQANGLFLNQCPNCNEPNKPDVTCYDVIPMLP